MINYLFSSLTVHRCFLSEKNLTRYWPFCPSICPCLACLLFTCSCGMLTSYAHSKLLLRYQKKITPYRNFFGNLNFKNLVIFFKRTCWLECIWIEIYVNKSENYLIETIYRPPDGSDYLPTCFNNSLNNCRL